MASRPPNPSDKKPPGPARILVVDDEDALRRTLTQLFIRQGHQAEEAQTGQEAIARIADHDYDLVVLDLRLPDMDGIEVLQTARQAAPETVFIILTGYGTMDSAILAVRHGAFDYLLKPSATREITRAVEAGLAERRRRQGYDEPIMLLQRALEGLKAAQSPQAPAGERFLQIPGITVDTLRQVVVVRDRQVNLTATEFGILVHLLRCRDRVITCSELVAQVRGYEMDERDARVFLRSHVHRLRQKIEQDPSNPHYIRTVRGSGYAITPEAPEQD